MTQPFFLHIVERLEGFVGRLPASIQNPVLHELTPLKQLFLQQRPPRFALTGSAEVPVQQFVPLVFGAPDEEQYRGRLMELFHWQKIEIGTRGTIELLDARGGDSAASLQIREELARRPADVFIHLAGTIDDKDVIADLATLRRQSSDASHVAKVVGIVIVDDRRRNGSQSALKLRDALQAVPELRENLLHVADLQIGATNSVAATQLLALLAREMPHEARVELVRISGDRPAQLEIAQLLVKSTAAICAAIGAQPIPLADLPILTALQLLMVAGIMHISGREKSVRAATEFIAALGVNVGAGMVLREGARAALKFFPGWGNVVCGMVAGAGTFAVGKAATVYFVEGLSLDAARRAYLTGRKRSSRPKFLPARSRHAKQADHV